MLADLSRFGGLLGIVYLRSTPLTILLPSKSRTASRVKRHALVKLLVNARKLLVPRPHVTSFSLLEKVPHACVSRGTTRSQAARQPCDLSSLLLGQGGLQPRCSFLATNSQALAHAVKAWPPGARAVPSLLVEAALHGRKTPP